MLLNDRVQVMNIETEASSSPSVETAMTLTKLAYTPAKTLLEFINEVAKQQPININSSGVKSVDEIGLTQNKTAIAAPVLQVKNGWLVRGDKLVTGSRLNVPWWNGTAKTLCFEKC